MPVSRILQRIAGTRWIRLSAPVWGLALILSLAAAGCGGGAAPAAAPVEPATPAAQATATAPPPATAMPATAAPAQATAPPATEPAAAEPEPAGATAQPTDTPQPTAAPPPATATPEPAEPAATEPPQLPQPGQVENVVFVVGEGSEATFTVNEKLNWLDLPNDAVMRTAALSGNVYLDGQPSVVDIDLHSLSSDSSRRDGYVRQRMFPNDPVATFTVTDLGQLPNPFAVGEEVSREVAGQLSVRGVTKPITFEVLARLDAEKLFILGRTTFTWAELEIPPPNIPGRIQVKDEVQVEVLLSATPTLAGGG